MNNFQTEVPLDKRDRLRVQRDQAQPLKKRPGEDLERDRRRPFVLEQQQERAVSLSERILERERISGLSRLAAERERELRSGAERRFDPATVSPLPAPPPESGSPAIDRRFDGSMDRRIGIVDDRDSGRPGIRPPGRVRSGDREREDSREKIRVKLRKKERVDDEENDDDGGMERDSQKENSPDPVQELVAQYKIALSELTFNSKPIITNLTIIAGEHVQEAKAIAETVCAHILEVPIDQKLPSLYLLDSIVKNIAGDYIKHFASNLYEVFCTAYRDVDPSIHPAMQHLFRTWRGIFPMSPLRRIEKELNFPPMLNGPSSTNNPAKHADSLSQRPGHSIHVNPKYIQAQRHRLQQSSRTEVVPSESNGEAREVETSEGVALDSPKNWPDATKRPVSSRDRTDSFASDPGYSQKILSKISDYDYSSSDLRADAGKDRMMDREEPWERTWTREDEDAFRPSDTASVLRSSERASGLLRLPPRDEYGSRQLSARSLVDTYGSASGPRAPRMPAQPTLDLDTTRDRSRNWRNSEEEEYVWENTSPGRLDHTRVHDTARKDEWLLTDIDKGTKSIMSGRGKSSILDQPFSDRLSWSRHETMPLAERTLPIENHFLSRRELNERSSVSVLHHDLGAGAMPNNSLDSPLSGSNLLSPLGHGPISKVQSRSLSQPLSPPAQSRSRPLQVSMMNHNLPPTDRGGFDSFSHSVNLSLPPSSTTVVGISTGVRGSIRQGPASFASGLVNFGSLSPVTPAASFRTQHRQSQRPPSPPPSFISQSRPSHRPTSSPPPLQSRSQLHSTLLPSNMHSSALSFQHVGHTRPFGHLSGFTQSLSSQQPSLPLLQQQHPPPVSQIRPPLQSVQQGRQVPPPEPAHQQPMARSQSNSEPQLPSQQQSSQALAKESLLPSNLLQSLQQLQNHLRPFSTMTLQTSLSQQQTPVAPSVQQSQLVSQAQLSQQQTLPLQPMPPQQSGAQSVNHLKTESFDSQSQHSRSSSNGLLAAFLQSGIMPSSQASLMLSHSRPLSPEVSSGPTENSAAQPSTLLHPPLPSGPPPFQFSNLSSTLPSVTQSTMSLPVVTSILTSAPVPVPPVPTPAPPIPALASLPRAVSPPMQMMQPPLPPGPPPASSQVTIPATLPSLPVGVPPPMNNFTSLLSSLVAQGLISAPATKTVASQGIMLGISGAVQSNSSTISVTVGNPPSSVGSAAAALSTLATALKAQIPSASSADTLLDKVSLDPIGTEFKQEILRERHDVIINALYSDFPRQCKTCGLRFKVQEEHSKHMDWHVARNRRQKSLKKVSRKWFVSVKEWLSGTGASDSEMAPSFFPEVVAAKPEKHEEVAVPADENQSACALCGEPFEDFYSDETEEWMYKGAVYMNVPAGNSTEGLDSSVLGPIVHAKCRSESDATPIMDSAEDDEN